MQFSLSIITLIFMFVALFFAFFLLTVKTQNRLSNTLMAIYLILFSIQISVFFYGFYFDAPLVLDKLRDDVSFIASPLLYFYVLSAIYSDFKLRPKHLWHFLPFVELKKYKKLILENFSNAHMFNYKWLFRMTLLLSFIFCI